MITCQLVKLQNNGDCRCQAFCGIANWGVSVAREKLGMVGSFQKTQGDRQIIGLHLANMPDAAARENREVDAKT